MASALNAAMNLSKEKSDENKVYLDAKKEKKKNKGSNLLDSATSGMLNEIRVLYFVEGKDIKHIKKNVRNNDGKKLTYEQVAEIILIFSNVAIFRSDESRYELKDEGKTLIDKKPTTI